MKIEKITTNKGKIIQGPFIIRPTIFQDNRGLFFESWNQSKFDETLGKAVRFCQDNHSLSDLGVIRGLHYQKGESPQAKLVRCVSGSIFDVIVDIRKSSSTFGEWVSVLLNSQNKSIIWIPSGFAHGFLSLEQNTEVVYKTSEYWINNEERSIKWDDVNLNIKWPLKEINILKPKLSLRDTKAPSFKNADIFT